MHLLIVPLLCISITLSSFQDKKDIPPIYPVYIGDIEFNKETDREDFKLCSEERIYQYFNNSRGIEYEGGKPAIEEVFIQKYKSKIINNETGLIRVNFIVNCKGETDRFRLIAMDENYNEKVFHPSITSQLINITKSLNDWKRKKIDDKEIDYYQYLIFKIENGQLKEILP